MRLRSSSADSAYAVKDVTMAVKARPKARIRFVRMSRIVFRLDSREWAGFPSRLLGPWNLILTPGEVVSDHLFQHFLRERSCVRRTTCGGEGRFSAQTGGRSQLRCDSRSE